jgi:DNA-binding NtrC family response regulator
LDGDEHVLFVDDDEQLTWLGEQMLQNLGYRVTTAQSGQQALQALQADPTVQVLVTDHLMPRLTGLQLAQEALRLRPGLPIVLTTGFCDGISQDSVRRVGIASLLPKPYGNDTLARSIRNAVAGARDA